MNKKFTFLSRADVAEAKMLRHVVAYVHGTWLTCMHWCERVCMCVRMCARVCMCVRMCARV